MFILGILFLIIGIWIYAKWEIIGPKWKAKGRKFIKWIKRPFDKNAPKIKKGAVIASDEYTKKLDSDISQAKTPQELLAAETAKSAHEKELLELQKRIEEKANKTKKSKFKKKGNSPEIIEPTTNLNEPILNKEEKSIDDLLSNLSDSTKPIIEEPNIKTEKRI